MERQAHLLEFSGSANPKGLDNDYDGTFLTKSQIEDKAKDIVGTPVWYEHDGSKKIGWITEGSVDDEGRLLVKGVINRDSWAGTAAARQMRDGTLKGLSLGMGHIKMKNQEGTMLRIVSKAIEEVSVTANPDRPDTEITHIARDSEVFELARQRICQSIEKHKTKKEMVKNRAELLQLVRNAQTPDTNIPSGEEEEKAMSDPTPVKPEVPTEPPTAIPQDEEPKQPDLSESEALKQKIEQQALRMQQLEVEKAQHEALLKQWRDDPDGVGAAVAAHKARQEELRAKMLESEDEIIERITADLIAAGVKPEPDLIETIKQGKERPDAYKPLFKYLKTAAGAAATARATDMEAKYQAEVSTTLTQRKEIDELRARVNASDGLQEQMDAQHKQAQEVAQRTAHYAGYVSGASDPRAPKRPVVSTPGAAAPAPAAVKTESADGNIRADVTFGSSELPMGIPGFGNVAPLENIVRPALKDFGDDSLMSLFESTKLAGMGRVGSLLVDRGTRPSPRRTIPNLFDA